MSGTKAGAKKAMAKIKERFGVDEDGKSIHHKAIGHKGGEASDGGYFARLKWDDPKLHYEISVKGGKASLEKRRASKN